MVAAPRPLDIEHGTAPQDGLTPKELATKSQKETVVAIMDDFEKHRSSASALTARTPHLD